MSRSRDGGVALVNVLVVLGLSASVVAAVLTLATLAIDRTRRYTEAGQALALIRAGELSAIAALRRDMIEAPESDHTGEAWSTAPQEAVEIEGGAFELMIEDAQGRFNVNDLDGGGLNAHVVLRSILEGVGVGEDRAKRIVRSAAAAAPYDDLAEFARAVGLSGEARARLSELVTALPGPAPVNVNAAPLELLTILLGNPVEARLIIARRDRDGEARPEDVAQVRAVLPPGLGYTSDNFLVRVMVRVGTSVQEMTSLVQRSRDPAGTPSVAVVRRHGSAAERTAPQPMSGGPGRDGSG